MDGRVRPPPKGCRFDTLRGCVGIAIVDEEEGGHACDLCGISVPPGPLGTLLPPEGGKSTTTDVILAPCPTFDLTDAARRDPARFVAAVTLGGDLATRIVTDPWITPEMHELRPGLDRAVELCIAVADDLRSKGHVEHADGILRTLGVLRRAAGRAP